MNKTALSLLLYNALRKLKQRTRASRCTVWELRGYGSDIDLSVSVK